MWLYSTISVSKIYLKKLYFCVVNSCVLFYYIKIYNIEYLQVYKYIIGLYSKSHINVHISWWHKSIVKYFTAVDEHAISIAIIICQTWILTPIRNGYFLMFPMDVSEVRESSKGRQLIYKFKKLRNFRDKVEDI